MENMVVLFEIEDGSVGILIPSVNCGLSLDEIISRDLDSGTRYKIVNRSDMPTDRSYRNAWQIDFTDAEVNE
jgi:hypothetical protein